MEHADHEHLFQILFHPPLVHFPIAFYFLELVLLVLWMRREDPAYVRFARLSFKLAYGFMIAAMAAGFVDSGGLKGIVGHVRTHALAVALAFAFYTARAFLWKALRENESRFRLIHVLGAFIGNLLIALAGYFGGRLVFE
jgi:uncharacterized membrane protein